MRSRHGAPSETVASKVPALTAGFWIIKVMSTTVGETCADYLAADAGLGHRILGSLILALLATALALQLRARRYLPWRYWSTVLLVSVTGSQLTDAMTDALGVRLYTSTGLCALGLLTTFWTWYLAEGALSFQAVCTRRQELFYWAALLWTFALGTAVGDLVTGELELGFRKGVLVFGALTGCAYAAWRMGANPVPAFWTAYLLTRPLGAALGDLLAQSQQDGGLGFGASATSGIFLAVIALLVATTQSRSGSASARA